LFAKEIRLDNKVPTNLAAFADPNHVRFLLRNLINNAIKFSNGGGTITVAAQEKSNFIVIEVHDNGVGISEERQAKLFEMSKSFSTEGTQGEKGTGLGLVLCREFVEKNGGKIWVESHVGKGSSFYFSLPKSVISEQ
jgi:signal transduction histidine kinase